MHRRDALKTLVALFTSAPALAQAPSVSTLIGTGSAGYSDQQVKNPYGLAIGPDGALYFCDLDNQRIRRLDLKTRQTLTVAGMDRRAIPVTVQQRPGLAEHAPRDSVRFRREPLHRRTRQSCGSESGRGDRCHVHVRWHGESGFSGDGGPASSAQLRQPHSIAVDPSQRFMLICDIGNHRIRRVELAAGRIETFAGTGDKGSTPDGAPLMGTPLNGPRTMAFDSAGGLYLALREGNAIYRVDNSSLTLHHVAGTGEQGYSGDGGQARLARLGGPKGLAWSRGLLYVADTENHAIREISLTTGVIRTVLGTGQRGDGPEPDPRRCALARPHGVLVDARGVLYVGDSEAHRIRTLN